MMHTILITNDTALAHDAETAGVSRIMVDLESIGKKERQASRTTFISSHTLQDIAAIRSAIRKAELIVRINPLHAGSPEEIEAAIASKADWVMLPMITATAQVKEALALVAGRAKLLPLIETAYSMQHLGAILSDDAIGEYYIGLNDLHLSLGMDFLFEPLARGMVDTMAAELKAHHKPFGFGGLGALSGTSELPALQVLAEHARLGSNCVILSSRFHKDLALSEAAGRKERLASAVREIQQHYEALCRRTPAQQMQDFSTTRHRILELADMARQKRISA
ncbi:MAG: aldolase/citrate lyase family protein [Alphaproteobacteria bacterium]|nr:aldolase/citrate lyase family protein [Alphaproteobacteria bacterium]